MIHDEAQISVIIEKHYPHNTDTGKRDTLKNLDTVLRHVQDVIYTKHIIHLDAVLRRTQDAQI